MGTKDFYSAAHLVVAAIRVLGHQNCANPTVEELCLALSFSPEHGNFICRKLHESGIIDMVKSGCCARLFVKDYLKIEDLPRDGKENPLQEEIERFQSSRKDMEQKIESFRTEKAEKQKKLFADIESRLRKEMDRK